LARATGKVLFSTKRRLTAFDSLLLLLELVLEGLDELGTVEILLRLPRVLLRSETLTNRKKLR
jgi:hypothetical protein